jgi:predicted amidohydrolase
MDSSGSTTSDEAKVKVACIQMRPAIGKVEANVAHGIGLINRAAELGAKLIVLPELSNTGYMFQSREEAFALSEPIPDGRTAGAWSEIASKHKLHLVAGICERDGAKLFNSAVLIGPDGYIGTFRKVHLWNEENLYFEPGDLGFPVFHTAIGRIGMAICYDGWFPETYRPCALQGADIVCVPTNWVPIPGQSAGREAMANILAMGAAHSNSIFIALTVAAGTDGWLLQLSAHCRLRCPLPVEVPIAVCGTELWNPPSMCAAVPTDPMGNVNGPHIIGQAFGGCDADSIDRPE